MILCPQCWVCGEWQCCYGSMLFYM